MVRGAFEYSTRREIPCILTCLRSEAVGGAGQGDKGAGQVAALVLVVPFTVRLQPFQIGVHHAATEGVGDEVQSLHVQVVAHLVDESPEAIDMVGMHGSHDQLLIVFAEIIHGPDFAILIAGLFQERLHRLHAPIGMDGVAGIAVYEQHRTFADAVAVLRLIHAGIAAKAREGTG